MVFVGNKTFTDLRSSIFVSFSDKLMFRAVYRYCEKKIHDFRSEKGVISNVQQYRKSKALAIVPHWAS